MRRVARLIHDGSSSAQMRGLERTNRATDLVCVLQLI